MPQRASARKLARALEMAHEYVNRVCAGLEPDQMNWHTAGCPESVRKQLKHLIQAERYFATRMGWDTPRKRRRDDPLAEYARLLEMYQERLSARRGTIEIRPFSGRKPASDHLGWVVLRLCFHALFHAPRITLLRRQHNPTWRAAKKGVSWVQLCDYLATLVGT